VETSKAKRGSFVNDVGRRIAKKKRSLNLTLTREKRKEPFALGVVHIQDAKNWNHRVGKGEERGGDTAACFWGLIVGREIVITPNPKRRRKLHIF